MTTTTPTAPQAGLKTPPPRSASSAARESLSGRWASVAAIVIAVLWTMPTFGLLVSSFRPEGEVKTSGWWNVVTDP